MKKIISQIIFILFLAFIGSLSGFLYSKSLKTETNSENKTFAIYVVYHKDYPIVRNNVVIPIQAGRILKRDFGLALENQMIGDDTGDNISFKNERFAELTALYWMWKNAPKVDYIGMMHYRRHFQNEFRSYDCRPDDELCLIGFTQENLEKLMNKYDIVLPYKSMVGERVYTHYLKSHDIHDLDLAINYIKKHYPEMSGAVDNVMNHYYFNNANMFVMPQKIYNQYAPWLFEVLFAIEDDLSKGTAEYNMRSPGFLAERLFNIWIEYNRPNYKIGEIPLVVF